MNKNLQELRKKIDEIDKKIIELIENRVELSKNVAETKRISGLEIIDEKREKELIESKKNLSVLDEDFIEELFTLIIKNSRKVQVYENQRKS